MTDQDKQKKRTHAGKACRSCKAAKTRCLPGSVPGGNCQRCERKGSQCDWETGPDRRKTRTDTRAHVEELEARIKELEAQLARAGGSSRSSQAPLPSPSDAAASQSPPTNTLPPVTAPVASTSAAPSGAAAAVECLEPDADGELRLYTGTNSFRCRPVEPPAAPSAPADYSFLPMPLTTSLHAEILDLAFKWQFDAFVTIERDIFVANMGSGTRTRCYSPFLHLGVLAIGCRYLQDPPPFLCSDPSDPSTRGEPFIAAALDLLPAEIAAPKFSTIRGLMVLAHYLGANSRPHSGWIYFGIACRMACDFGLTIDPPADSSIEDDLRICRRKLFWDVFAHDVSWSLFIGRSTYFSLSRVRQPFLSSIASSTSASSSTSSTSSAAAAVAAISTPTDPTSLNSTAAAVSAGPTLWDLEISLSLVAARVLELNYSNPNADPVVGKDEAVRQLVGELEGWFEGNVPREERSEEVVVKLPALMQLHFNYYLLLILLFRPYLSPAALPSTAQLAVEKIDHAASMVVGLLGRFERQQREEGGEKVFSDHLYQVIFHAGAVSLELASRLPPSSSSTSINRTEMTAARLLAQTDACIAALQLHARWWTSAGRCEAVLRELREAAVAERASMTAGEAGGAGGVKQEAEVEGEMTVDAVPPQLDLSFPPLPSTAAPPSFPSLSPSLSSLSFPPPGPYPPSTLTADGTLRAPLGLGQVGAVFPLAFGGFAGDAVSALHGVGGGATGGGGGAGEGEGMVGWGGN